MSSGWNRLALALVAMAAASCSKEPPPEGPAGESEAHLVAPPVTDYAILARHGVQLADRAFVINGAVGVARSTNATPNQLSAGPFARVATGKVTLAQRIILGDQAGIGDMGADRFDIPASAIVGSRAPYLDPPAPPEPGTFTAGTTAVNVGDGVTTAISAGKFGAITIGTGTLNLRGGIYEIQSLRINPDGRVVALAPSTVRVTGGITALDRAFIMVQAPLTSKDLRLVVAGTVDSNNTALTWGTDSRMTAFVITRGIFRGGLRFIGAGAVAAQDVTLGVDARLTFENGFGCGSAANCDDGNPCSIDTCIDAQCSHANASNGTACSDGNACTRTDACQAGACVGASPVVCSASDACHDIGTCDTTTGVCSNPNRPNGTACHDGSACTRTDTCQAGACVGANPVVCMAGDQCHDVGTCNPASGMCSNPPRPNGTVCTDGNACSRIDTCQTGTCTGSNFVTCSASDQCHDVGTCNPASGICSDPAKPNGSVCSDGNACTRTDTCQAGTCAGSNPVVCVASDVCHGVGLCDPGSGVCSNPTRPDGTSCDDGNTCSMGDSCLAGVCTPGSSLQITEFPTGLRQPTALISGSDGALWFVSPETRLLGDDGSVGWFEPNTGEMRSYPARRFLADCITGPDGNIWVRDGLPIPDGRLPSIGRVTTTGTFLAEFAGIETRALAAGTDGNVWYSGASTGDAVGRITTGGAQLFPYIYGSNLTRAITAGPDGNMWITESNFGAGLAYIGRITPAGTLTEFLVATSGNLNDIARGPDGNLWFTDEGRNEIGRITPGGAITKFPIPTAGSVPFGIVAGPDNNLWFTERSAGQIGRITPAGQITELCIPTAHSGPSSIAPGSDGNMWFTEFNSGGLGRVRL